MSFCLGTLDYLLLAKEAKNLDTSGCKKTIRMAILADFAAQQLVTLLKVLGVREKIKFEIYEANYDSIDLEILNQDSGLYRFEPDYIVILVAAEKQKSRFYEAEKRSEFAVETVARFKNLWNVLKQLSQAIIIQGNFVLPSERAFGNYEHKVPDSMGAVFTEINFQLSREAREAKHVMLCDIDHIAAEVGRKNWMDARLWNMAKVPCRLDHLPLVAKAVVDIAAASSGIFIKCVVLDLDNTLWGGVIGDDGLSGIVLGGFDEGEAFVAFQKFILELKRRGIILAVVSKNDHANAILPFKEHPNMILKETDISVFIANWDNKADNIRLIQKTLNIGFDSMVFIDDNPFERNIVREFLPDVIVPEMPEDPVSYIQALADLNLFETATYSEADQKRNDQYREEAQRSLTKTHFTNIDDYLSSLDMKIKLERFNPFNLPRIAQLIQRSNQFNLMTRRYGEAVCAALMDDPTVIPLTVSLADKFGDYGLISIIILKRKEDVIAIDEYLMSCRVLQRGVEHFAMNKIVDFAQKTGAQRLSGSYIRTDKNEMVKEFYGNFGFTKIKEAENGSSEWVLAVHDYKPSKTFLDPVTVEL